MQISKCQYSSFGRIIVFDGWSAVGGLPLCQACVINIAKVAFEKSPKLNLNHVAARTISEDSIRSHNITIRRVAVTGALIPFAFIRHALCSLAVRSNH